MRRLDATQTRSRLRFDSEVARELRAASLGTVRGFVSRREHNAGSEASPEEGDLGRIAFYEVELLVPHLVGPGETAERTLVTFDLLSGGNYPYSDPAVTVTSRPLPWSPHVHPTTGLVCIGDGWRRGRGQMLFAQLLVHVMRILNCDEPDRGPSYGGWNAPAARYWRQTMRCRPVSPDLGYPLLPAGLTHGTEEPDCAFRAVGTPEPDGFAPLAVQDSGAFRPAEKR